MVVLVLYAWKKQEARGWEQVVEGPAKRTGKNVTTPIANVKAMALPVPLVQCTMDHQWDTDGMLLCEVQGSF